MTKEFEKKDEESATALRERFPSFTIPNAEAEAHGISVREGIPLEELVEMLVRSVDAMRQAVQIAERLLEGIKSHAERDRQ